MRRRIILSTMILLLSFLGLEDIARAVPVVNFTDVYNSGTGLWTYESTILNDTSDLLYDFVIYPTVEPLSGADLTAGGWGPADMGTVSPYFFVHWMADFGAEIQPGDTMSGFWFTYSGGPGDDIGQLTYEVTLWNLTSEEPSLYGGVTVPSPSQVPEPSTFIILAGGIIGLVFLKSKR